MRYKTNELCRQSIINHYQKQKRKLFQPLQFHLQQSYQFANEIKTESISTTDWENELGQATVPIKLS
jgi:hypothetical protein